jgi:PAS domain S-box-containing protein
MPQAKGGPSALFLLDRHGRVASWNREAQQLWGYAPSEIVGEPCGRLCPPELLERARQQGLCAEEGWRLHKDGTRVWVEVALSAQSDEQGELTGFVVHARSGETLRRTEARFRALVDASAQIVWTANGAGEAEEDSPSWRAFTGQTYEEWSGWGWLEALHPDDRARTASLWESSIARQAPLETEYRVRHKSGEWRWTAVRAVPLLGEDGSVREWVGMNTDITEREHAAEQFRLALEAAPTGMLMVDPTGKIVLVNAQAERVFGYAREELIGQPIELLVPERFRAHHPVHRGTFMLRPTARLMGRGRDLYGLRKDGTEFAVEVGLNPLQTPEGDFVLCSAADITERKRAERELEERVRSRTTQLSGALKEREVLLQEVHHRVKNNLQVITSLINMQLRKVEEGSSRDALEECQTRVQAIALIHEKLYQSRDYSKVPFMEYVRSLATSIFHTTGVSPSTVALELAIEDVSLAVDKAIPCGLVLNELITNALKHAFPGERAGTLRVELAQDDRQLRMTVRDDGVGLPEGFDVMTSESLGLQLVCTLAEQLDAKLEVSGEGGATFQLTFSSGRGDEL